jgi:Holliday junction DNA helicase RuvA
MIATLSGKVISKQATFLVIDCNGIGFLVNVPFPFAQSVELNSAISINIQSVFTRNGMELYGFKSAKDKELFNILTSIRGIGGRAGISILSRLSADEITEAIDKNRVELFKTIPGIGQKKAETIVFNLRKSAEESASIPDTHKEVIQGLRNLGFSVKEALQKLSNIPDWTKKSTSELIQTILKTSK